MSTIDVPRKARLRDEVRARGGDLLAVANDVTARGYHRREVVPADAFATTGVYVNMLNFDEMCRVVEAFGGPEKYAELGCLKARYDPENLFRMSYNIPPSPGD
jgi:hypothetical protein